MYLYRKSLLFLLISLVSCSKIPTDTEINLIEEDLYLFLSYDLANHLPTLNLHTTSRAFCDGSNIQFSTQVIDNNYHISLQDITSTADCEFPEDYATAGILIDQPEQDSWDFTLDAKSIELANGDIEITTTGLAMVLESAEGLVIENERIQFIPENHLFGFYSNKLFSNDNLSTTAALSFVLPKWVDQLGSDSESIKSNQDFGHFTTLDNKRIIGRNDLGFGFVVAYEAEQLDSISSLLSAIRTAHDSLSIRVINYDGQEL